MVKVNFRTSDFRRQVADAGDLVLKNRFFEQNPFLSEDGSALIARPGMRKLVEIGSGPIRGLCSQSGTFDGDLFAVSGGNLYRVKSDLTYTTEYTGLYNPEKGFVKMCITAQIGEVPEYLFFADGRDLLVYMDNGYATNTLSGSPVNNDVVVLDTTYYKFTSGAVDTGSPAGTSTNPWLVSLGSDDADAFQNFFDALNVSGEAGVQYSSNTVEHPDVKAQTVTGTSVSVRSKLVGALGNSIASTETGAGISWANGATLTGGGDPVVMKVELPEDQGVIDVAVINSFVIVIPTQTGEFIGRFYWIQPGETTIDPLDYATAERSPDGVNGVQIFGDQFWLAGDSTTEVWYVSADADARMQRLQGVVFDRGSWLNTAAAIHERMVVVDSDGGVFLISGGSPQRVSTPDIEEEVRNAIALQQSYLY